MSPEDKTEYTSQENTPVSDAASANEAEYKSITSSPTVMPGIKTEGAHATSKSKKALTGFGLLLIALVLAGLTWLYLSKYYANSTARKPAHGISSSAPLQASDQKFRLYQLNTGTTGDAGKITLTDTNDKVIASNPVATPLHLMAALNNQNFLLKEDDFLTGLKNGSYGGHYWLMDSSGKLSQANSNVDAALRKNAGGNNPVGNIFPLSDQEVLYYQCDKDIGQYCGQLHELNVVSGSQQELQTGNTELMGVSQDGKTAFLLALKGTNLRNISFVFEQYDLASQKVISSVPLPSLPEGARQLWVSPTGAYVAYADENGHTINVFSIKDAKTQRISVPPTWELNSWSGEVTLPSPKWSPDEKEIAFVAWNAGAQYMAIASVQSQSYKLLSTLDTANDAPESTSGPGLVHHSFDSLGWQSNMVVNFAAISSERPGGFGSAVANYSYDISASKPQNLTTAYGEQIQVNLPKKAL